VITGTTYLEHGRPVVVLAQWSRSPVAAGPVLWLRPPKAAGPRNVLIERGDGSRVVRPFRGLRKAGVA
jgi:acetyl esterase